LASLLVLWAGSKINVTGIFGELIVIKV